MRSLVPTLKKSTWGARRSAVTAALGTSRFRPMGTSSAKATPSRRSPARVSSRRARTTCRSLGPVTNGNMMRSGPWHGRAQQGAELGPEGLGGAAQQAQRPLPQRGVRAASARRARGPRGPTSQVRTVTGCGPHLLEQAAVDLDLPLLGRPAARAAEEVLGAEEADALRAVLAARCAASSGNSTLAEEATRTPSRVTQGSARVSCSRGPHRAAAPWPARSAASAGSDGSTTTARLRCRPPPPGARRDARGRILQADHRRDPEGAGQDRGVMASAIRRRWRRRARAPSPAPPPPKA